MKYFVYCLMKEGEIIYIGSSSKLLNRIKKHNTDKDFDTVKYCELPNKQTMLDFEIYAINKVRPPLNRSIPEPKMLEKPEGLKWIRARLYFLEPHNVDINYIVAQNAYWSYISEVCEYFNIVNIDPYGEHLSYVEIDGKVLAVFDGSGQTLKELAAAHNLASLEEYTQKYYQEKEAISVEEYEESLRQFD